MSTMALAAAKAYAAQTTAIKDLAGTTTQGAGQGGQKGFEALLKETLNSVGEAGKSADMNMQAQAMGKADIIDVVTAVAEAELTVKTLASVRDRMLSAYQDILRMPI
ncbi:MAG: flagellar hook-basal body complex protein FliE [Alphaproteobacteria bacterium]